MRIRRDGFTLLEVLVAVAVFAILAALSLGALRSIVATRARLQVQTTQLQDLARTVRRIENDLQGAVDRPVRDAYGGISLAFVGGNSGFALTRIRSGNDGKNTILQTSRVQWRLQNRALQQSRSAVLDAAPNSVENWQTLLADVSQLQWRYFDQTMHPSDVWPPINTQVQSAALPRAVEFSFVDPNLGTISRLYALVDSVPERTRP
jgi:general secretion pathway protein J